MKRRFGLFEITVAPPAVVIIIEGKEPSPMAVSQDVQDFCTQLPVRVQAAIDAAVATEKAANEELVTQMQQDHADEIAALKQALDTAAPPVSGG